MVRNTGNLSSKYNSHTVYCCGHALIRSYLTEGDFKQPLSMTLTVHCCRHALSTSPCLACCHTDHKYDTMHAEVMDNPICSLPDTPFDCIYSLFAKPICGWKFILFVAYHTPRPWIYQRVPGAEYLANRPSVAYDAIRNTVKSSRKCNSIGK